jgi:hypothetical protein
MKLSDYFRFPANNRALVKAAIGGNLGKVEAALRAGTDPDARNRALKEAAFHGNTGIVRMLLVEKIGMKAMPEPGWKFMARSVFNAIPQGQEKLDLDGALSMATLKGRTDAVKVLLEAGANPNAERLGLMEWAASANGLTETVNAVHEARHHTI